MCGKRFILLVFISIVCAENDDIHCPPSSEATTPVKLKNALLCQYDSSARPVVNHQNSTSVSFRFILKYFSYEITSSTLTLDVWMTVYWKDEHLTWNPEHYDNIRRIHLETFEIWTPDLSVYNRAEQGGDPSAIGSTKCAVSYNGGVLCVPSVHIEALCIPDLSMYPFDTQHCVIRMGSWVHKGEELDIKLVKNVISMDDLEPNGEWEIVNYTSKRYPGHYKCCPNTTYPSVEINFKIKRLSGAHAASVIIPTVVGLILTFTSLLLSPTNKDRLVVCYVNVFVEFMHVQYLSWQVPLKGDRIPLLLLFARDSLLLSSFTVAFTLMFKNLMQRGTTAPTWIPTIVSGVVGNRLGQFIFLDDNSLKGVASAKGEDDGVVILKPTPSNASEDWVIFGKILDFILLVTYIVAYFIMFMKFVP